MSDLPALSTLALPPDLDADDVLGFRDQFRARFTALIRPKGKKHESGEVVLPAGVTPRDSVPALIERPWQRFDTAATELEKFRGARASAQADALHAASIETEKGDANTDCDDRWRAFEGWNGGAAKLAEDGEGPSPAEARWLHLQLFPQPQGLRFITRRPRTQWTAMVQRMKVLEGERAQAVIQGFGGLRHYGQLVISHDRFGKAYGFTAVSSEPTGGPTDGRPQWVTARDGLRTLIQKIEAYADPEIEGSEALATFLLAPYVELVTDLEKSRRARAKKGEPVPAPVVPVQNPT